MRDGFAYERDGVMHEALILGSRLGQVNEGGHFAGFQEPVK
jgi:hypothetical protein